ncbi:DUF7409 domain-containing protein [Halobellus rarus]|uniref:Helix-hairpin-helix domain-containing protein n=1 Tax=Halobellus rarus TaxID=1126237 RepID=A0ABD6CRU1_9EURY|nr:helix-hairpin-helix domain-containing protein [Halobellus rarus]
MTEDEGGEGALDAGESDAAAEEGSDWAAVPDRGDDDLDIPLPWNTVSSDDPDAGDIETGNAGEADEETTGEEGTDDAGPTETEEESNEPERFEDLRFVGPKSAAALRDSRVSLADLVEKRIAYRDLKEAGVNPGVAAKIRREHSLSWSLDGGGTDLDRRSTQVRGLDDDERAWIAASSGWSEESAATETDGSGDATEAEAAWRARTGSEETPASDSETPETAGEAAWRDGTGDGVGTAQSEDRVERSGIDAESAWREQSVPTPVTALDDVDERAAATLRRAGIGSVRRLATADPESVADALELDRDRVETWCRLAREHE